MRLKDKVAIVTGAASGMGKATVLLFGREGAKVVVSDRNGPGALAVAGEIANAGGVALAKACDVSRSAEVAALMAAALGQFGRIDILVNNAGYGIYATVEETDEEAWDALMDVNLKGTFLCSKAVIPIMRAQGGGAIVNMASVTSMVGISRRAAYCASKGGVASLTRAMAIDHAADKIRVNAVGPGTIDTPFFDEIYAQQKDPAAYRRELSERQLMGRLGTAEEIATAILYLASDEASFCTGSLMMVDGGMTAR